jgi:tRNA pseudouridine synthase 10
MLLDEARAVVAQSPVCDSCLGRPFADRSHGLTVAERGRALRVTIAVADDEPFEEPDPEECWVCEGETARYDEWAERVVAALSGVEFETYQVGTRVPPLIEENERLLREDAGLDPDAGEMFKAEFNREVGRRLGGMLGVEVDFDRPDILVICDLEPDILEVQINPAFVYGRYRKLERDIPQTEWPCRECHGSGTVGRDPCDHCGGSGYLYEHSVEQHVAPHVQDAMDGTDALFHGAGREDVDALMLGTGRPFVVEVKHPSQRFPDLEGLEAEINAAAEGAVEVEGLRYATHEMVERVKELEANKTYRAEIEFETDVAPEALADALDALAGATIEQRTPDRVSHRRADLVRTRTVHAITGELEDDRHATIEVEGAGGLYIKELLHGDDGRTDPSLAGLLGATVTVTSLDVIAVEAVDGTFENAAFFREPGGDSKPS